MPSKILIIDDERGIAQALAIRLRAVGYDVATAENGKAGIAAANEAPPPAAIVLDVRMPDMDGLEVNRHLKASPATAGIPVIFLSANVQDNTRQAALATGAWAYLTKPFNAREVIDTVGRAITKQSAGTESADAA